MISIWWLIGTAALYLPLVTLMSWASFRAGYDAGYRGRFPDLDEEVEK